MSAQPPATAYRGHRIMACRIGLLTGCCLLLLAARSVAQEAQPIDQALTFESDIQPLLKKYCLKCHGTQTSRAELDLSTGSAIRRGSESGTVLNPEQPRQGRLYEVLHDLEMPPEDEPQLQPEELRRLLTWIERGAPFADAPPPSLGSEVPNQHDVLPIVLLRCATCHGRQVQQGGLDLRTRASMLAGGTSGPAIVPGDPESSRLVQRIRAEEMSPRELLARHSVKPVEASELRTIVRWIEAGAPEIELLPDQATTEPDPLVTDTDRRFWSFQPPIRPAVPQLTDRSIDPAEPIRNPIDAFIRHRLDEEGLHASEPASPVDLLRRVTFDLTGLPPTPSEIHDYLSDRRPDAWSRLVDRLLESPQYGERWGQYWLDLSGYADSEGVQHSDPIRPEAWRYRDYVIRSFNANKPYDRFLLEQLAGDELADYEHAETIDQTIYDNLVATGFLRMTSDGTFAGITGFVPNRLDVIDDQIRVLSSSVMGLTIRCARCHSHKFDPIPQRDYYRLAAVLKPAMDEHDWLKPVTGGAAQAAGDFRYLPYVTTAEQQAWQQHDDELVHRIDELKAQRSGREQDAEFLKANDQAIQQLETQRKPRPVIRALWDRGEPSPTYLLRRGDYLQPARLVGPGVPSVLTDGRTPFQPDSPFPNSRTTGNRLALARWLTAEDHPLTARVFVNRLWRHHFGQGIVRTLDNFGHAGDAPSHPQLLDWLAVEFMRSEWDIKHMHRLMLNSATYRQSSRVPPEADRIDPENRLLAHMPLRRMEAEVLRDTLLSVSGQLNTQAFGPADPVESRPDGLVQSKSTPAGYRRSIYVLKRRTQRLTLFDNFDRPRMSPNCVDRMSSTVAPQALQLMNNARIHELSQKLAERVLQEQPHDREAQTRLLLELTVAGSTAEDRRILSDSLNELHGVWQQHLAEQHPDWQPVDREREAWRRAFETTSHAVLNSAAFLYID